MDSRGTAAQAAGAGMGGIFIGILIGAVIGGIAALLFAPQSGTETREMIRNRSSQMKDVFRGTAEDTAEMGKKTAGQVKQTTKEMK
jgi:gas vesicle protein